MSKQKNKKSLLKRVKITSGGKILRRHQLGAGHLKRHKSKGSLSRHKKNVVFFQGEARGLKRIIGL